MHYNHLNVNNQLKTITDDHQIGLYDVIHTHVDVHVTFERLQTTVDVIVMLERSARNT